jgi:hypothetical protein
MNLSRNCHSNTVAAAWASLCVGMSMMKPKTYHCMAEANPQQLPNIRRRKRPPTFGSTVPSMTKRGLKPGIGGDLATVVVDDREEDCPMCKKFGSGPCGDIFKQWLKCTDKHPGKDAAGEPLHLTHCLDFAEKLGECLDTHSVHYSSKDNEEDTKQHQKSQSQDANTLKAAWCEFVSEMEDGIKANKFTTLPFPDENKPSMHFNPKSKTGAAIFSPDVDGASIITAYIIDDNSNVIAAGSKEDMDMGSFGCVLRFDITDDVKSATIRAIYDSDESVVRIFTRTMLVPRS